MIEKESLQFEIQLLDMNGFNYSTHHQFDQQKASSTTTILRSGIFSTNIHQHSLINNNYKKPPEQ